MIYIVSKYSKYVAPKNQQINCSCHHLYRKMITN